MLGDWQVYMSERRGLRGSFKGKTARIREQIQEFRNQQSANVDTLAYLNATPGHEYAKLPKWIVAENPFTHWKGPVFSESPQALLIGNRSSFDVGQYKDNPARAGMSMIHLLCIPKAGIYNGVSLSHDNVAILEHMADLFRLAWSQPHIRQNVLRHQLLAIERQNTAEPDAKAHRRALEHYQALAKKIDRITIGDFGFGLHLYPDHSVGHLHMHIVAMPYAYRKYSTSCHDEKTKDAFEVRDSIRGFPSL
ncbi:hypothetical protein F4780DRAFT_778352 [Xylariomycetidae sp. FL0641]|nr:hypothetical protein F4780DRAFT_778352 [Xylariomycetidae sp. FL0641]